MTSVTTSMLRAGKSMLQYFLMYMFAVFRLCIKNKIALKES